MTRLLRWRLGPWHVQGEPGRPLCDGDPSYSEGTDGEPTSITDAEGERLALLALCGGCRERTA